MYKQSQLTSIPEIEVEEDLGRKWVPKKKHEVLKAKYKCLKKLFQIYDASVIGMLPEPTLECVEETPKRRRKRSHRTKTDACAGTNEISSGDNTINDYENSSVATAIIRDLQIDSSISTQFDTKIDKYAETIDSNDSNEKNYSQEKLGKRGEELTEVLPPDCRFPHLPYVVNEKRKLTRFQCFVQRLFGIRRSYPNEQLHAASDPMLTFKEKRRRRGMRYRRLRRPQKMKSDSALRDMKNPSIMSYVQSVQRNYLMDTTPRQCPILGCKMISYGIINYNDHLNLCHFKDRRFICHYCHEGFEKEIDKYIHENEHIGITKLNTNVSTLSTARNNTSNQTEPETKIPEEKLKKMVSFFEKFSDSHHLLSEAKKNRDLETNLTATKVEVDSSNGSELNITRTISCGSVRRRHQKFVSSAESDKSSMHFVPLVCHFCGENFHNRRQLLLHVDFEHRVHDKFSKLHSCAGIINRPQHRPDIASRGGSINVRKDESIASDSLKRLNTTTTISEDSLAHCKSKVSIDPSNNIVYYTSTKPFRKPLVDSLAKKVQTYHWEPGTKIIRV